MFNSRAVFYIIYEFWQHYPLHVITVVPYTSICKILFPTGIKTAETQKSWFIFFQSWLNCVPAPAGGYFKLSQNGTVDSDGGWTWSCHSQCLHPLSLRCQALEGCHGYPKSVCHPPWRTHRRGKTHSTSDSYFQKWKPWNKNVKQIISLTDFYIKSLIQVKIRFLLWIETHIIHLRTLSSFFWATIRMYYRMQL